MKTVDLTSKLLATENLTIVRSNSSTAFFDTKTRVLNLPIWKDMTDQIESMMSAHEVGHALYTTGDEWFKEIDALPTAKEKNTLKGYFNVVEDARIEKLMKRTYPGLRKTFGEGYDQLVARDFFKIKGRDFNKMLLIDRINLYFKAGFKCGVKFTAEEKQYVNRVEKLETIEEALALAKELVEFAKQQASEMESFEGEQDFDEDEDGEYELSGFSDEDDSEEDSEDDQESNNDKKTSSSSKVNDEPEIDSETDKNLNKTLEELADTSVQHLYYELNTKSVVDVFVPYKDIISDFEKSQVYIDPNRQSRFKQFMTESERVVNYLVKEFEMKKSAQAYRRAQTSKSGSLNVNKLHAYKLSDDIFKRVTTLPVGKNHGMIFLLDWSGSMLNVIDSTVKQVINLAMFCRRVGIPFEVYAFSDSHWHLRYQQGKYDADSNSAFIAELCRTKDKNIIFSDDRLSLLNIFSSKMTTAEFNKLAYLFSEGARWLPNGYTLSGTPLNEALVQMLKFIPEYKNRNNIEKLTFITLTDGEGGTLQSTHKSNLRQSYWDSTLNKSIRCKHFISDPVTAKSYQIDDSSCTQTEAIIKMIGDRYDVKTLGFYIIRNNTHEIGKVYRSHYGTIASTEQLVSDRNKIKEYGFCSLFGTGRDELFIVADTSTKVVDDTLKVDGTASAAVLARKLGKVLNTKKHSRVLLDRFIDHVA